MQEAQKKLGKRIRRLRNRKGLTQRSFAALCNTHCNHLGAIERGEENLTLSTLRKIARNLDTTGWALLKGIA